MCERDHVGARCLYIGKYDLSKVTENNSDGLVFSCLSSSATFIRCKSRDSQCCDTDWCNCPGHLHPTLSTTLTQENNTTATTHTNNPTANDTSMVHPPDEFPGNSTGNTSLAFDAPTGVESQRKVNYTQGSMNSTNTKVYDSSTNKSAGKVTCKPCYCASSNRCTTSRRRRRRSSCCKTSNEAVATATTFSPGLTTHQARTVISDVTPASNNLIDSNHDDTQSHGDDETQFVLVSILVGSLCGLVLIVLSIVIILLVIKHRRRVGSFSVDIGVSVPVTVNYAVAGNELDMTLSDSGPGLPSLEQLTICRQITLTDHIGTGRYGDVWCGKWMGEKVAVKIFASKDEESWDHEVNIYQTPLFRHSSVLGFIASDRRDTGTWTQLWLVTDYCEFGSLYDFLSHNAVDVEMTLKLAETAAAGLSHLHMSILGMKGKPAMAHRDIKSRNYLVRRDCSCVLGDFGLAVTHDAVRDAVNFPCTTRVGTIRYMAPEVLTDKLDSSHFESFKRADIYSFALVLWEITRRCHFNCT